MKQQQGGFTLIELISVIVILGILAATAVPKFVDLSASAEDASLNSFAGSLASASALNHAANIADDAGLSGPTVVSQTDCQNAENLLETSLPSKYTITSAALTDRTAATCTLNGPNSSTATFIAYGATP